MTDSPLVHFTCPKCGATLEIPKRQKQFACRYCGTQLSLTRNGKGRKKEQEEAFDAELRDFEYRLEILDKEKKRRDNRRVLIFLPLVALITLAIYLLSRPSAEIDTSSNNREAEINKRIQDAQELKQRLEKTKQCKQTLERCNEECSTLPQPDLCRDNCARKHHDACE